MKNQREWRDKMKSITKELAKLEKLNWAADTKVAESVFPYVLIEAINLLLNAKPKDEVYITDYTETSEKTRKVLEALTE